MSHHTAEHRSDEMNQCIDNCSTCHAVCLETIHYCLEKGGKHAEAEHINLMSVCADICATSADAMLRGASVHTATCGACAEVCRQCAEACAAMGDDADMQRCAEACRRCADSCGRMARAG
ncbi:four-helix bundle copper-binding protein [Luteimonas sp. RD2P54]|uniref:Four-helix bundle copper-binding protein n=1 Tax=Luteimonas endophytica TaxID=3042023 RepID=A0ABT6J7I4_9GAMM|nr:four-helix bundle copper-binding protein [Luteimonas endophytica]MDH5822560.1 four-helix bundle copper-binding protein [Luteimonas endophytica]